MRLEDVTVAIRPRGRLESIDLGFGLAREHWRAVWRAWALTALPVMVACIALGYWVSGWLSLLLWWFKPLYDRVALWVLSRVVFGGGVSLADLRRALPALLTKTGLGADLTVRRFGLQRSFNLPVTQLEQQRGLQRRRRLQGLQTGTLNTAQALTLGCLHFELVLYLALFGLAMILLPPGAELDLRDVFSMGDTPAWFAALTDVAYVTAISVVEPFYVAGGFALYLNRRTWLEGWDLELEFRRMAASVMGKAA
jgi:hypothetical protein